MEVSLKMNRSLFRVMVDTLQIKERLFRTKLLVTDYGEEEKE